MKTENKYQWIMTDPDTNHYGRQFSNMVFEFKEDGKEAKVIDLDDYPSKELEHIINAFGYTFMTGDDVATRLNNINKLYGKSANWVVAECVFETI